MKIQNYILKYPLFISLIIKKKKLLGFLHSQKSTKKYTLCTSDKLLYPTILYDNLSSYIFPNFLSYTILYYKRASDTPKLTYGDTCSNPPFSEYEVLGSSRTLFFGKYKFYKYLPIDIYSYFKSILKCYFITTSKQLQLLQNSFRRSYPTRITELFYIRKTYDILETEKEIIHEERHTHLFICNNTDSCSNHFL